MGMKEITLIMEQLSIGMFKIYSKRNFKVFVILFAHITDPET